jgi:hypothetical protein
MTATASWAASLVGPWMPTPETVAAPHDWSRHWSNESRLQEHFAQDLQIQARQLSRNQGRTADDLIERIHDEQTFHLDLAEKYQLKARANDSGAGALDHLVTRLNSIAQTGSDEINSVIASKKDAVTKLAEIQAIQARCNAEAATVSAAAVATLISATQQVLTAEGIATPAQEWMRANGIGLDNPQAPKSVGADDLPALSDVRGRPLPANAGPPAASAEPTPAVALSDVRSPTGSDPVGGGNGTPLSATGHAANATPGISTGSPHVSTSGGGLSPASALGGSQGLSPDSLGHAFTSGAAAGQPAAAGAQSLTSETVHAAAEPPPATPPIASLPPALGASGGVPTADPAAAGHGESGYGHGEPVPPPVAAGAPPVLAGGPVGQPLTAASPATPLSTAGPLPAYGADLRPPVAATPPLTMPPVAGAPVASSATTAPSAGSPLFSPLDRAPAGPPGQAAANGSPLAAASAATGAATGGAAAKLGEQQRLQRLVAAAARQEPRLSWAAGLLSDGTTTVLVTDLAGGWIPPHVKLPRGVTLLEPVRRRPDVSVLDLLGASVVSAAYQPHSYIGAPSPDDPPLSGERARHGHGVEEMGPTLVDTARRIDGLQRLVVTAAHAVTRNALAADEIDEFRRIAIEYRDRVLTAYPDHKAGHHVAAWMLAAAIDALIDGQRELGSYHLAWAAATTTGATR